MMMLDYSIQYQLDINQYNMKEINKPEVIHDFQKGYLTLPFNDEQFKEFIKGLLGTPQTITKRIRGNFEIHLKDLQNFNDLINQRVAQQNNGKLIQLKTQIYYSDESSVILSSYEELITYNEVKPIISEAVRMTWVYLIQFADKTVPEKQEIEIMIISTSQRDIIEYEDIPVVFPTYGQINLSIMHTARSWGSDIESLLTNQINSILIKPNKFKDFLRRKSNTIGLLAGTIFFLACLISIFITTREFNNLEIERANLIIKKAINVDAKINYILSYLASNKQELYSQVSQIFFVVSFILAVFFGTWIASLANNKAKSYLVLTREAKTYMDASIKKSKNKFILFFISIGVSVITKIIASFIFSWCSTK